MFIVKVTYTVKDEYAQKNSDNIANVMACLRKLNHPGINYCTYLGADGVTFTHLASFKEEEFQKILFAQEPFQKFQQELKASQPVVPVSQEKLKLVGSSYELFG